MLRAQIHWKNVLAVGNILITRVLRVLVLIAIVTGINRFYQNLVGRQQRRNREKTLFLSLYRFAYFRFIIKVFQFLVFLGEVVKHKNLLIDLLAILFTLWRRLLKRFFVHLLLYVCLWRLPLSTTVVEKLTIKVYLFYNLS